MEGFIKETLKVWWSEYLENYEICFSLFFSLFEAIARENFQGAYDHFLVPATKVPETVRLIFSIELLTIHNLFEVGS